MVKVLFVCLGNICRSPTAEGVFTALINREGLSDVVSIDSAGTGAFRHPRDPRSDGPRKHGPLPALKHPAPIAGRDGKRRTARCAW